MEIKEVLRACFITDNRQLFNLPFPLYKLFKELANRKEYLPFEDSTLREEIPPKRRYKFYLKDE